MCGIAGFVSLDGPRDPEWLDGVAGRMQDALAHRGPDGGGRYVSEDARVAFASRRLAIIDRSPAGEQPMHSPDGLTCLAYNGELYDHPPLPAGTFAARGYSDTETLLRLLHHSGAAPGMLARLNGMFAFAFHDRRDGSVLLARDHFGVKPLYYAEVDHGIAFASEPQALLASGLVTARLDPLRFALYTAARMDAVGASSWFRDICVLEPATALRIDRDGTVRVTRYWHPVPAEEPVTPEEVGEAFRAAVACRRRSDVPLAAFLSGGLDSTAVVAGLLREGVDVQPFVVCYEGEGARQNDDLEIARTVAGMLGVELAVSEVRFSQVAELAEAVTASVQRPSVHGAELAMYLNYEQVAAAGRVVVYSGHGSDELWGYQDGRYFPMLDPAFSADMHSEHYLKHHAYPDEHPRWHAGLVAELLSAAGLKRADLDELIWSEIFEPYRSLDTLDPYKRARFQLMRRFLVYVDDMVDALSMAFSLEDRPVFQDVRLAELALGMPEYVKNREGLTDFKPFLKAALRDLVPEPALLRPKAGFPPPDDAGFSSELRAVLRERGLPFGLDPARLGIEDMPFTGLLFLHTTNAWLSAFDVRS